MADLNEKQKRFCEEYIIDLNGTQAAIRAGYSEKTAYSIAEQLLRKLEIQASISEQKQKRSERTSVTADAVIKELAKIAFANIKDYLSFNEIDGVRFKDSDDVDGSVISEVSSITTYLKANEKKIILRLKLHDKVKTLEMLGRHLNIFGDNKNDLTQDEIERLRKIASEQMKNNL